MNREQKEQFILKALSGSDNLSPDQKTALCDSLIILVEVWSEQGHSMKEIVRRLEVMRTGGHEPWMLSRE